MIILDINPMAKPRMVKSDSWRKRDLVEKYWQWKNDLNYLLLKEKQSNRIMHDTVIGSIIKFGLSVKFLIQMPKSWSKNKKSMFNDAPHQLKRRNDLDNLIKALQDAIFEEDSAIWRIHNTEKRWAYSGKIIIYKS